MKWWFIAWVWLWHSSLIHNSPWPAVATYQISSIKSYLISCTMYPCTCILSGNTFQDVLHPVHAWFHLCICRLLCVCMCVCVCVCVCVMYMCMCVCPCVFVCVPPLYIMCMHSPMCVCALYAYPHNYYVCCISSCVYWQLMSCTSYCIQ